VDERRALTKFLLAVDWTVESEVVQAAELLEQWKKRSPIEVTDALKLLGRNVAFQTGLVRSYAIETLANAPDEELRLYLLQLVQALKYEEDVSGGSAQAGGVIGSNATTNVAQSVTTTPSSRVSSLSAFLIDRASKNIELANYLFWYLRVELENRTYESRYREVCCVLIIYVRWFDR
jgi:phosphatidylinositol 3-kinase